MRPAEMAKSKLPADAENYDFHGFQGYHFQFEGYEAIVVFPEKMAFGNPWVWRGRWFGHEPQTDIGLLERGFTLVFLNTYIFYGAPGAVALWEKYYDFLRKSFNLSKRAALIGMSQGALIALNFAKKNPDKVSAIYIDNGVCDFKSWPGGFGKSQVAPDWINCQKSYGITCKEDALNYKDQPFDNLKEMAAAKVPILAVCGDIDSVVPLDENMDIFAPRYEALGGPIRVVVKKNNDHHPHSFKDPSFMVNHLCAYSAGWNDYITPRNGIARSMKKFLTEKKGTVAFLGGSIVEMNGFSKMTEDHLRRLFPECEFTFVNAGISSTCSDTGAFRVMKDVMTHEPDLVFAGFATNDNQDGMFEPEHTIRGIEGIVRTVKTAKPETDIVLLYTTNQRMLDMYSANSEPVSANREGGAYNNTREPGDVPPQIMAHQKVADHYGIPSINFSADLAERIRHGECDWEKFGGVHPAPYGNAIYAESIRSFVEYQRDFAECIADASLELPAKLNEYCYADGTMIPADQIVITNNKSWTVGEPDWDALTGTKRDRYLGIANLYADQPGAEVTVAFTGRVVGFFLTAGPDAGMIEYSIDGGEFKKQDLYHHYSSGLHYPRSVVLADELSAGEHTITIRISAEKNEKSGGHAARLIALEVCKN